jgi:ADP-ribosylglycohydrolase
VVVAAAVHLTARQQEKSMLGAITGDIIGSVYEHFRTKRKDFRLFLPVSFFTDDTVLSVAVAEALLNGADFGRTIKRYAWRRPLRGYGPRFYHQRYPTPTNVEQLAGLNEPPPVSQRGKGSLRRAHS